MSKNKKDKGPLLVSKSRFTYDDLTADQQKAVDIFDDWFKSRKSKKKDLILRIGGHSGVGKSTLIKYIIERYKFTADDCYVVAYTGQAVNVLRQAGILAKTIHSSFMQVREVPLLDEDGNEVYRSGVQVMRTKFKPLRSIPSSVKLIICDEASFLPEKLEKLMVGYNVALLEVGDPLQLPPVSGKQCFEMANLDYLITTVMRQAEGSEIVDLATRIRRYEPIDTKSYGNEVRFLWAQPTDEETFFRFKPFIKASDMILTGTNKTRGFINDMYRENILKAASPYPIKGEKLICRKNDWDTRLGEFPLTNGTQGYAIHTVGKSEVDSSHGVYYLDFRPTFISNDYFDGLMCNTNFLRKRPGEEESYLDAKKPGYRFEYAHAITVHASQGSQANTVMYLDHFNRDIEYHMRMRYTAVTRAVQRLWYVLPYSDRFGRWTDLWKGGGG